jgi:nucleotide-binding universal stress UspA family protein
LDAAEMRAAHFSMSFTPQSSPLAACSSAFRPGTLRLSAAGNKSARKLSQRKFRWELIHSNVLAPKDSAGYGSLVPTFNKILTPTDFSEDSKLALSYAVTLAQKFSSEIIVVHVDQPLAPVMVSELNPGLDVSTMNRIAEEGRLLALKELDETTARLRESGIKARGLMRVGAPFLEIIHTAQSEGIDLIVMGTHGRTGLAHVLMGSVAERVVNKAPCPVLTVRHPDRKFKHPLDK